VKIFFVGLWLTVIALGATYGAALYAPSGSHDTAHAEATILQHEKTRTMNVPIIVDGAVQGFIGMQFVFTIDAAVLKSLAVPPEVYLMDEAFSTIYMDKAFDFRHLEKFDLPKFTHHLVESTNAHLGAPMIKDVLIEAFSYIPKEPEKE
jgi:hypothetical protein